MGVYFRKSVKIFPGVRLNVSKTGTSWSIGPRGLKLNIGKKGTYLNSSIPGTGIYSRQKLSGSKNKPSYSDNSTQKPLAPHVTLLAVWFGGGGFLSVILSLVNWSWNPIIIWAVSFIALLLGVLSYEKNKNDK